MTPIPDSVRKLIEDEAWRIYPFDDGSNKIDRDRFLDGATFGYSIRQGELDKETNRYEQAFNLAEIRRKEIDKLILELGEKDKEIEQLKLLIEKAWTLDETQMTLEQFKSQNHI